MARKTRQDVKLTVVATDGAGEIQNRKAYQIMSAAIRLFLKDGFEGVTMELVAAKAGVSKSTLYAHFTDKKQLFTAVMINEASRVNDQIWPEDVGSDDVESMLRNVAYNFYKFFMTERAFAFKRVLSGALHRFPEIGQIIFEAGPTQIAGKISSFLATAHESGRLDIDDPDLAAIQFMSLIRSDVEMRAVLSINAPPQAEIEERIEAAIKMFLVRYGRR